MPIRQQAFIKDGDKNENEITDDIITTIISMGKMSFVSKDLKYIMTKYPLKDQFTKKEFGLITALIKVEGGEFKLHACDITINTEPKKLRLTELLPDSSDANEHYSAVTTDEDARPLIIETVNRYALWDENLEGKEVNVGLSAFAFEVFMYDSLDDFNKQFDFFPMDTPNGQVKGFSNDFVMTQNEFGESPYTTFLGKVINVKDVKVKLTKHEINFSIINVECFLGTLPVVANKNVFNLSKLEKGKTLRISADIKADFGVNPSPEAILKNQNKKEKWWRRNKVQDNEPVDNAITRLADASYDVSSDLKTKVKKAAKKVTGITRKNK